MSNGKLILAIDQGTTSSRAIVFDLLGRPVARAQKELPQIFPKPGWVEHDAECIWRDTVEVCGEVLSKVDLPSIDCIGITNQRETTVIWNRKTGIPIANAIVWQDRRTAALCDQLRSEGQEDVHRRTGLLLDPYFSATKIAWLLDTITGARAAADRGELAFGTIDCFLLWRLTGGKVHASDVSNAARTMLFDISKQCWDEELLRLFRIPASLLPEVRDSSGAFGETLPTLFGRAIPITGIAGDQQAATFGQAAFDEGAAKSTYGTGCFLLRNTGSKPVFSKNRLLTTIAWRIGGATTYAVEGAIFMAGAAVQWLRDGLKIIPNAAASEALAAGISDSGGVYVVPAFTGLGAPYWDPEARGAILGLTRASGAAEIARATLESISYQSRDLLEAMTADGAAPLTALRVDGGLVANNWSMQNLSDILGVPVERPVVTETTALGASYLAGLATGAFSSMAEIAKVWRCERRFLPEMAKNSRESAYSGWKEAVARVLTRP